jgi:hypothetical protein
VTVRKKQLQLVTTTTTTTTTTHTHTITTTTKQQQPKITTNKQTNKQTFRNTSMFSARIYTDERETNKTHQKSTYTFLWGLRAWDGGVENQMQS